MYNVGMYGGSFDPVHLGHVNDIVKASSMCKELYVVLSYSKNRDHVNYKQRYQWLAEITKEIENIKIIAIEDVNSSKDNYNWDKGAQDIKNAINKNIDVVFCGDDYKETNRFESLYPESEVIYFSRSIINISSTEIRKNPIKYWDYLPKVVQPYFCKKVLIVGSESTGKSTLTRNLALAFNTTYLEEVGRTICERAKSEDMMLETDFLEIMVKHKAKEYEKLIEANKVLFIDTDCITTLFYSGFLCEDDGNVSAYKKLCDGINHFNKYDLIIYLDIDTDFIQDGTRNEEIRDNRKKYSNMLKSLMNGYGLKYYEINGSYLNRFEKSFDLVKNLL